MDQRRLLPPRHATALPTVGKVEQIVELCCELFDFGFNFFAKFENSFFKCQCGLGALVLVDAVCMGMSVSSSYDVGGQILPRDATDRVNPRCFGGADVPHLHTVLWYHYLDVLLTTSSAAKIRAREDIRVPSDQRKFVES